MQLSQVAEIAVSYSNSIKPSQRPKVECSQDAYLLFRENWDDGNIGFIEEFKIMHLNRQNRVLGITDISKGGVVGTHVNAKVIFAAALKSMCTSIICAHNHPSGNLNPSRQDLHLTSKLFNSGKLLDLQVADHIIMTSEGYTSLSDNCQMDCVI